MQETCLRRRLHPCSPLLEISFSFQYLILGQIDSYRVFCKLELSIVMLAVIQVSFDKYSSSGMKTNMLLHGLPEYRYLSIWSIPLYAVPGYRYVISITRDTHHVASKRWIEVEPERTTNQERPSRMRWSEIYDDRQAIVRAGEILSNQLHVTRHSGGPRSNSPNTILGGCESRLWGSG